MVRLADKEGLAGELAAYLEEQTSLGFSWVVYDSDQPISGSWDLVCYRDPFTALEDAAENQQIFNWHVAQPILELMGALKKIDYSLNNKDMNRNSLENFRAEVKALKVPEAMAITAESMMEQGVEKFTVHGQIPSDAGKMDVTIHMKKSGQSDYYYLNRFEVAQSKAKPLEKDHKYLVTSPNPAGDPKNLTRQFESAVQAMDYFREQKGNSELAAGRFEDKDMQYRDTLVTMKDGKIDYVKKEFSQAFYSPIIRNSHYVDRGKGFSIEQAANMLQGRSAFREDLVSRAGEQYKAWSVYQFDQPKDRYGNYTMKQFGEGYGFDLKKELAGYQIKELEKPEQLAQLVEKLENGNRPLVTVVLPNGQEKALRMEAVPRYNNLNFFEIGGKPVKREELKKDQGLNQENGKGKSRSKEKNKQQENTPSM
ncbi:hypothetical protein ASU31_10610 [Pedobacter ginsenosidimutans]|uniref:Uncharacterized protein n=1 Tax=Pedobacter ginsenosidimutans TaxID=687842 RepID=A0A0T5VQ48_9SPHI|nr:hypothetical protein [Pedobacter ginsenosidimutans]KRT15952.1 hypothetical protein ASU31_10610 [Pedobacter ginsenosidimutans]